MVAEENGIVGFINIRCASHPRYPMFKAHEFAMIEDAVVAQSVRGRGIGTQLFSAAIAWAHNMVWSMFRRWCGRQTKEQGNSTLIKGFNR